MLPSPLTFQTPVGGNGPSFLREDEAAAERKRKSPEGGEAGSQQQQGEGGQLKRVKT